MWLQSCWHHIFMTAIHDCNHHTYIHTHAHTHACTHTRTHTHTHTHTHTRMHTHTHTHLCTYVQKVHMIYGIEYRLRKFWYNDNTVYWYTVLLMTTTTWQLISMHNFGFWLWHEIGLMYGIFCTIIDFGTCDSIIRVTFCCSSLCIYVERIKHLLLLKMGKYISR